MVPVLYREHGALWWLTIRSTARYLFASVLTVVYIIEVGKRVVRIVDHERAPEAVAVLEVEVAVVPERTCNGSVI